MVFFVEVKLALLLKLSPEVSLGVLLGQTLGDVHLNRALLVWLLLNSAYSATIRNRVGELVEIDDTGRPG